GQCVKADVVRVGGAQQRLGQRGVESVERALALLAGGHGRGAEGGREDAAVRWGQVSQRREGHLHRTTRGGGSPPLPRGDGGRVGRGAGTGPAPRSATSSSRDETGGLLFNSAPAGKIAQFCTARPAHWPPPATTPRLRLE